MKLISDSKEITKKDYDVIYYNETSKEVTFVASGTTPTPPVPEGYVDLGLPSKTYWAKCNIGATKEEEYGKYFQWGDTVGYEGDEAKAHSTWSTAPFNSGSSSYNSSYFTENSGTWLTEDAVLRNEYDAAYVATNGAAHMPTKDQWNELTANTTTAWTQVNNVNGIKFTASNGNYVFFPAAGCTSIGSLVGQGFYAYVRSSSLNTSRRDYAWSMRAGSGGMSVEDYNRCLGLPARGVVG